MRRFPSGRGLFVSWFTALSVFLATAVGGASLTTLLAAQEGGAGANKTARKPPEEEEDSGKKPLKKLPREEEEDTGKKPLKKLPREDESGAEGKGKAAEPAGTPDEIGLLELAEKTANPEVKALYSALATPHDVVARRNARRWSSPRSGPTSATTSPSSRRATTWCGSTTRGSGPASSP